METALIVIAIVSSGIAVAMAAVVIRMLREERRRSDARVEALVRMAGLQAEPAPAVEAAHGRAISVVPRIDTPARATSAPTDLDIPLRATEQRVDVEPEPAAIASDLFAEAEKPSVWPRRAGIAASIAVAFALVGIAAGRVTSDAENAGEHATEATVEAPAPAPASLELLSLKHEQQGRLLTISGVVQNPKSSAAAITGVEATALLLASNGALVASGGAPIDFSRLQPGDESPFVVRFSVTGAVARYRIGFRDSEGRVIAHVDRRAAGPLARNE